MPKTIRLILLSILPLMFCGMMVSLIVRVRSADAGLSYLSTAGTIIDPSIGTTWYSIRRDGALIGYARTTLGYAGEQEDRYASVEETVIQVDGFGDNVFLTMHLASELDNTMTPLTLNGTVGLGSLRFALSSIREGSTMQVVLSGMGTEYARNVEFRDDLATTSSAYAVAASRARKAGDQFRFQTFDALSQSEAALLLTFRENTVVETPDGIVDARHFTVERSSLSSEVWLDLKGRMLREESSTYISEITGLAQIRQFVESHPAIENP